MVKHLLSQGYKQIRIFSRDEWKQEDMRVRMAESRLKFYIGDVRNRASVDGAMEGVNMLFHAAALKQVPSCEFFPMQAVETNIIGSNNVLESAVANKVESVVVLGTDKAVYPVNAMGMTKAVMEKVAQSIARRLGEHETTISSVRYGNVMYSRGSVIPFFVRRTDDVAIHAAAARFSGTCGVRVQSCEARRHLHQESSGLYDRHVGTGDGGTVSVRHKD